MSEAISLDASDVSNEADARNDKTPLPGKYHVVIREVDDSYEKVDKIIVRMEVGAGTTPKQEGLVHTEFFPVTANALPRLKLLAIVTGLLKPGQVSNVDFNQAVDRFLVIVLEESADKNTGKLYTNITWDGMYSVDHADVLKVNKNQLWLNYVAQQKRQEQPAQQPTQQAATPVKQPAQQPTPQQPTTEQPPATVPFDPPAEAATDFPPVTAPAKPAAPTKPAAAAESTGDPNHIDL